MYKKIVISLIISSIMCFIVSFGWLFLKKEFRVKNFQIEEMVNVNSEYLENEPDVCYGSLYKCQKLDYQKEGLVDISKIGEYNLVYHYQYNNEELKLEKKVVVVDKEKPTINVLDKVKICSNGKVWDKKYEAYDNYDGDLTDKVTYLEENGHYYLEVSDSSENKTKVEADILVSDEGPELTLKGDSKVYLLVGKTYKEPGFTASDICDGDLTSKVVVKNNINYNKAGTYQVSYSVSDSQNNQKTIVRQVIVFKKNSVINPTNKTIYLTFDDGPSKYTGKLLDILDEYDVKVTFFVTNQFPTYQKYIKEAYQKGHSIGIHTYSHNFNIYRSVDAYFNDLNKMNEVIKQQTGEYSKILRFPGGSSNTISKQYQKGIMKTLANEVEARGYSYFDWNLGSGDTDGLTSSSAVSNRVIKNLGNKTRMVLMHDIKSYSVDAVRSIIEYGLSNGYTFDKININSPTYHHTINN